MKNIQYCLIVSMALHAFTFEESMAQVATPSPPPAQTAGNAGGGSSATPTTATGSPSPSPANTGNARNGGAAPTIDEAATIKILTSGKWYVESANHAVWYTATFHEDKSVTVMKPSGATKVYQWRIDGGMLSIIYPDYRDIIFLPLDPKGMNKGQGRTASFLFVAADTKSVVPQPGSGGKVANTMQPTPAPASTPRTTPVAAAMTPRPNILRKGNINIDLPPDSTLGDFVATLKEKYPDYAVNLPSDQLNSVKIGEIKLRGAMFMELVDALRNAGWGRFNVSSSNNTIFFREFPAQPGPPPTPERKVFNLELPEHSTIKDFVMRLTAKLPQYTINVMPPSFNDAQIGEMDLKALDSTQIPSILNILGSRIFSAQVSGTTLNISEYATHQSMVSTFNIGPWLGQVSDEAVRKKIEQLNDMVKEAIQEVNAVDDRSTLPVPTCSYMEAGKIYVITGAARSVNIANQVLQTLVPKAVAGGTHPVTP